MIITKGVEVTAIVIVFFMGIMTGKQIGTSVDQKDVVNGNEIRVGKHFYQCERLK
jgi:hypothetical protein